MLRAAIILLLAATLSVPLPIPNPHNIPPPPSSPHALQVLPARHADSVTFSGNAAAAEASAGDAPKPPKSDDPRSAGVPSFWNVTLADVVLVLLAGALFFAGSRQWRESRRQYDSLRKAIEKSEAASANRSADIHASVGDVLQAIAAVTDMAKSLSEGAHARSGGAVTGLSPSEGNASKGLGRAYLSVSYHSMAPQGGSTGARFEPRLNLLNAGQTPACKIRWRATAAALPVPLRSSYGYALPERFADPISTIAPGASRTISATVLKLLEDTEMQQVESGSTRRIVMWGEAIYEDVEEVEHFVRFCHSFVKRDGQWSGVDTGPFNDSN